jgi:hypothetical protein
MPVRCPRPFTRAAGHSLCSAQNFLMVDRALVVEYRPDTLLPAPSSLPRQVVLVCMAQRLLCCYVLLADLSADDGKVEGGEDDCTVRISTASPHWSLSWLGRSPKEDYEDSHVQSTSVIFDGVGHELGTKILASPGFSWSLLPFLYLIIHSPLPFSAVLGEQMLFDATSIYKPS